MRLDAAEGAAFVRRVLDTYNSHRVEAFDALLTEDCVLFRDNVEVHGRDAIKRVLAHLYRAIPDLEYRIDEAITSGDKAAILWQGHGTLRGEYLGIAPTGAAISYGGITFFVMRGDRVRFVWVSTNLVQQLRRLAKAAPAQSSGPEALH